MTSLGPHELTLPFRLKVAGKDEWDGMRAVSTSFRVHGFLRFDGEWLTIEWGGVAQVQDVGFTVVKDDTEALPDERIDVSINDLYRVSLEGGWFRPRLKLEARALGVLSAVPGVELGVAKFWYARAERFAAVAMVNALREAIDNPISLPPVDLPETTPRGGIDLP